LHVLGSHRDRQVPNARRSIGAMNTGNASSTACGFSTEISYSHGEVRADVCAKNNGGSQPALCIRAAWPLRSSHGPHGQGADIDARDDAWLDTFTLQAVMMAPVDAMALSGGAGINAKDNHDRTVSSLGM
jgi:hypothetical protein